MELKSETMVVLLVLYAIPMIVITWALPIILGELYYSANYTFETTYIGFMLNLLGALVFVGLPLIGITYVLQCAGVIKE